MKFSILKTLKLISPLVLLFVTLSFYVQAQSVQKENEITSPYLNWENANRIDQGWLYLEKEGETIPSESDDAYAKISLPHTWNALDVLQTNDYRMAGSWYRKHLYFTADELKQRQYVRFLAAGQQAKVYLNGEEMIHHFGGYSAFTCELSGKLKNGDNQLDVWVSNAPDNNLAPLSGDFNFYGGLYRGVELISAPQISVSRKYYGGQGVRVWSENVSNRKADLHVTARIDNGSDKKADLNLLASLVDPLGKVVASGTLKIGVEAGQTQLAEIPMPEVMNPKLWSPENPSLYQLKIEVRQKNKTIDKANFEYGFRWFQFTADKGFFLNGKPYKLHGVSRHQDYFREGNAISLSQQYHDFKLMKEAGINWVRLAHYQQDDYALQMCDELGILVEEEIPWVNKTPKVPGFEQNLHSMMTDLINQHFNHPAIILWGMGNEVWIGDRGDGYANIYDVLKGLNTFVHSEDPIRKTIFVTGDNNSPIDYKVYEIPDVFGYNLYRGWYGGTYDLFTARVNELHQLMPGKPLIITEFGAGSDTKVHSEKPQKQDFSIEYQNNFMKSHLDQLGKMDWLCGFNWWVFADFGAAHRGDTKPHVNQKGLLTFDREKKDVFYLMKSRFSTDPVLYLETPTWTERNGEPDKTYRVFTNMDEVELFQNGHSVGKQKKDFVWHLTLVEGDNILKARGTKGTLIKEHGFTVIFQKETKTLAVYATPDSATHPAKYAVDGDPETWWSAENGGSIQLDLDRISLVNGVTIRYTHGKVNTIPIEILVSADGEKWVSQFVGYTNKNSENESFMFPEQLEIRYIKIVSKEIKNNDFFGFSEIVPMITFEKKKMNLYEKVGAGQ